MSIKDPRFAHSRQLHCVKILIWPLSHASSIHLVHVNRVPFPTMDLDLLKIDLGPAKPFHHDSIQCLDVCFSKIEGLSTIKAGR